MFIGIPKEIKDDENRVGMTPGAVQMLVGCGHRVLVQNGAGAGSGIADAEYHAAGATLVPDADSVWAAEMVVKVKEPVASEYNFLRPDLLLFTYLHLAANKPLTERLLSSGTTAVAYETVTGAQGQLPLLAPMSEVAGRMATQVGATCLEKHRGGRGVLLGGVPGVAPGQVTILGGGIVGLNAAKIALGMGALVTILDTRHERLQYLDDIFAGRLQTRASNQANIEEAVLHADLVIGAVLIAGRRAPWLVTRDMLPRMRPGSVIVDVAVDQGGCVETSRATTHHNPTYVVDNVVHYCVANMPGAVPRTSTFALVNQTLPYTLELADQGVQALRVNPSLQNGLSTHQGKLTYRAVAESLGLPYTEVVSALQ